MTIKYFISKQKYTWKHKAAFLKTERQLLGHNTWRGYMHDMDKVIYLYLVALILGRDKKWVHTIHQNHSHHHPTSPYQKTRRDYIEMIIDWECARYTKPDKPLNAYETMKKFYPSLAPELTPIMRELGLIR